MTEDPTYSRLFSGLAVKSELNQLLDELYDPEQAPRGEATPQTARITPHYYYRVPNDFEDFVEWFAKLEEELKEEDIGESCLSPSGPSNWPLSHRVDVQP